MITKSDMNLNIYKKIHKNIIDFDFKYAINLRKFDILLDIYVISKCFCLKNRF